MSSSTAQRDRLVGPLGLALLACAFVIAFFLLKLDSDPGSSLVDWLEHADASKKSGLQLDELDLAYIKAKKTSGDIDDAGVVKVVLALLRAGRNVEAQHLLAQFPGLAVDKSSRTLIDLELAAAQSDDELAASLRGVLNERHLQHTEVYETALEFSKPLQHSELSFELYKTLAARADVNSGKVYRQCGDFMSARSLSVEAAYCYHQSIVVAPDSNDAFDSKLLLLGQLPVESGEQQVLIDSLLNRTDLNTAQLARLAPALLAVERPDVAYRVYARLALADKANANQWLQDASTWAQAANKPTDAAVFLDSLANQSTGEERKRYLREIVNVLVAAGQSQEAFNRIRQQLNQALASKSTPRKRLDADLAKGVDLARQLGKPDQALEWNTQRLAFDPTNATLLTMQRELALAVSDLPQALLSASDVVRVSPADVDARERLARVSEWNSKPVEASQQWLWLSDADNQPDEARRRQALREVVRLSSATFQSAQAAKALRELTLLEKPDDDDVLKLVSLYELEGLPASSSDALNDIMLIHGRSPFLQRTLAMHDYKHKRYAQSLQAWQRYSQAYGFSSESTVYQMELLWRLDEEQKAVEVAKTLRGSSLLSQASDYQLRLMAEIAWRYELPWLAQLVQPRIQSLKILDMRKLYGRRSVESLTASGKDSVALQEAMALWQGTGQNYFALSAMQLALKRGNQPAFEQFLPEENASAELLAEPDYWLQIGRMRMNAGQIQDARSAYEQALKLDASHVQSISSILWLDIANARPAQLQQSLQRYKAIAQNEPRLWQAMAVGFLELGAASTSVAWFDKFLDQIDTDYGMLLTYADALEYAGRASDARRVREYTMYQLRPLLVEGASKEKSLLLRQYARLSTRYSGVNHNEALMQQLMDDVQSGVLQDPQDVIWREDLSISWLMSTQRHEQARVVMTNLHSRRIQAPVWQRLALALKDKDATAVKTIVDSDGPLSIGNHILALRQLGHDRQAYALAQQALRPDALNPRISPSELQAVAQQYVSLRRTLPSYISGSLHSRDIDGISTTARGISIRHSLIAYPLGLSIDISQRSVNADRFRYDGEEDPTDVAVSLFFGNRMQGGHIMAGVLNEDDRTFGAASLFTNSRNEKRRYTAEFAFREQMSDSAELYLGARQNRASAKLDASLGNLPFLRLQADATQINTRRSGERFADGLGTQAELGVRGQFASNNWAASVQAGHVRYQRSNSLPDELSLRNISTVNSVLQEQAQRVSVGASLSRGAVNDEFAQVNSPRYFLDARLGHSWPSRKLGLSLGGGAGIRVLGGDELSFSFRHDAQGVSRSKGAFTALGIGYRYHF